MSVKVSENWYRDASAANDRLRAENERLREALVSLYPGLVLDLRYADDDDDKDAMRSRIETVREALNRPADAGLAHPAASSDNSESGEEV